MTSGVAASHAVAAEALVAVAPVAAPTNAPLVQAERISTAPAAAAADDDWDDWDTDNEATGSLVGDPSRIVQPSQFGGNRMGDVLTLSGSAGEEALNVVLACSNCGHPCLRYPQSRWESSVDYYHLRNFAPDARMPERMQDDLAKLCTKLVHDHAAAAYACGCSWLTVVDDKQIAWGQTLATPQGGARLPSDDQVLWWK